MKARRRSAAPAAEPEALLGFRIPLLATLRSATSARRNERLFGLKNLEGRALFVIGANGALSLMELVRIAGIEKAYASRTIAALVTAGLVAKTVAATDRRAVRLTLTPDGDALYQAVLADSIAREEEWVSILTAQELAILSDCLVRLIDRARQLVQIERKSD